MLSVLAAMTTSPLAYDVISPLLTEAIASFDDDHLNILFLMEDPLELMAVATS